MALTQCVISEMQSGTYFIRYLVAIACGFVIPGSGIAQDEISGKGDRYYRKGSYIFAIPIYEKQLRKEENRLTSIKIADCYFQTGRWVDAEMELSKVANGGEMDAPLMLQYADVLQRSGKFEKAIRCYRSFEGLGGDPEVSAARIASCEAANRKDTLTNYRIIPATFNSEADEFAPALTQRGILFSSNIRHGAFSEHLAGRNLMGFHDLYLYNPAMSRRRPRSLLLSGRINKKFHESHAVISPAGGDLVFTRSVPAQVNANGKPMGGLIYHTFAAKASGRHWKQPLPLSINLETASTGHPSISEDGRTIIFSSNREGGWGGNDLWMSKLDSGRWLAPINLGPVINTSGNEGFPFIHPLGYLFFASDQHAGYGGLDIFNTKWPSDSGYTIENVGQPINSTFDDFSIFFDQKRAAGFFASNRNGGMGGDDIYQFRRATEINCIVIDRHTGEPVNDVKVQIIDSDNQKQRYETDSTGNFSFTEDYGKVLFITLTKDFYVRKQVRIATADVSPTEDISDTLLLDRDLSFLASGIVRDLDTGEPLSNAEIKCLGGERGELTFYTKSDGYYRYRLPNEEADFSLLITKEGYMPEVVNFSTIGRTEGAEFGGSIKLQKGEFILIRGNAIRDQNFAPLQKVTINAVAAESQEVLKTMESRADGKFYIALNPNIKQFLLIGSLKKYFTTRVEVPFEQIRGKDTTIDVTVTMVPYKIGALVKTIYYDYNRANIRTDAGKDLFEIAFFMIDNPSTKLEIGSHTDSRGRATYNAALSQQRADEAADFISRQGVDRSRIVARGYGENLLVNHCQDGVTCSEEAHSLNRRTEIRVTGFQGE